MQLVAFDGWGILRLTPAVLLCHFSTLGQRVWNFVRHQNLRFCDNQQQSYSEGEISLLQCSTSLFLQSFSIGDSAANTEASSNTLLN